MDSRRSKMFWEGILPLLPSHASRGPLFAHRTTVSNGKKDYGTYYAIRYDTIPYRVSVGPFWIRRNAKRPTFHQITSLEMLFPCHQTPNQFFSTYKVHQKTAVSPVTHHSNSCRFRTNINHTQKTFPRLFHQHIQPSGKGDLGGHSPAEEVEIITAVLLEMVEAQLVADTTVYSSC